MQSSYHDFERDVRRDRQNGMRTDALAELLHEAQHAMREAKKAFAGKGPATCKEASQYAHATLDAVRQHAGAPWEDDIENGNPIAERAREWVATAQQALDGMAAVITHSTPRGRPPEREWLLPGWLPAGRVTRLSSHGGSGKSYLALELAAAIATGMEPDDGGSMDMVWREGEIGAPVLARTHSTPCYREDRNAAHPPWGWQFRLHDKVTSTQGHVLYLTWEDEMAEVERRLEKLPSGRGAAAVESARIHVAQMERSGPLWAPVGHGHISTVCTLTDAGRAVEALIAQLNVRLVVIDPVAAAFAGNENDRAAVRRWLSHLNAVARETGAAILLISHPPKSGDSGYSGSTDWDNGVRAAWTLAPYKVPAQDGSGGHSAKGLSLVLTKANYARKGARLWLRWTQRPGRRGLEECTAGEAAQAYHNTKERAAGHSGDNPAINLDW